MKSEYLKHFSPAKESDEISSFTEEEDFFLSPITLDEEDEDGIIHRGQAPDPESFNEIEAVSFDYYPQYDDDNEDSD